MPAPFALAIDVEPGPRYRLSGALSEWDGFERSVAHIEPWRHVVLERTGQPLVISWFLRCDPQISIYGNEAWVIDHFHPLIRDLQEVGDEFGLHVHPYHQLQDGSWRQDYSNEAKVLEAVARGLDEFERRLGPVRNFRGGDCYLSDAVIGLLDSRGVGYDLTIEPGRASKPFPEPDIGMTTDYRRAPRQPYRPAYGDFLRPDSTSGRALCMVPLATGCFHHPHALHPSSTGHRIEMMHVAFDSRFFQRFVDSELAFAKSVVAVTRTGDVDWSPWMFPNFDYLFGHRDLARVQFVGPAELVARRSQRHAVPPISAMRGRGPSF